MEKLPINRSVIQDLSRQRREDRDLRLNRRQINNLWKLLKRFRRQVVIFSLLSFSLVAIESCSPLIFKYWTSSFEGRSTDLSSPVFLGITAVTIFLALRFWEIYLEKWLMIECLNRLRRAWYFDGLMKTSAASSAEQATILAKLTYHFGLLQMGMKNVVFQMPKIITGFGILILVTVALDWTLFQLVASCLILSVSLIWLGNFLAKNYVSKDQTLYSKMLLEIQKNISCRKSHSMRANHDQLIESFDRLVALDSFFRLRRELWMKFSPQLVLLLVATVTMIGYLFQDQGLDFTRIFSVDGAVLGLVAAILIRHLYASLQLGLFAFPLYLGLVLSVPEFKLNFESSSLPAIDSLAFRSNSARLGSSKRKRYHWEFRRGDRVCIESDDKKPAISSVLLGSLNNRKGKSWLVVHNGDRFSYNTWKNIPKLQFHISALFSETIPLIQLLTGILPEKIVSQDIEQLFAKLGNCPYVENLKINAQNLRYPIRSEELGWEKLMAIQIIAAVIQSPPMIIVDHAVSNSRSGMIEELLVYLSNRCSTSIITGFSPLPFECNKTMVVE